jgi:hypothetical protein
MKRRGMRMELQKELQQPDRRRNQKHHDPRLAGRGAVSKVVGETGFEPVTSCV